ncbi:metal ABC transporter ATP-binding protein [candidate division KSB1 bacterium]|nr:metal ABC transporter ATP-binding protein [candidate division KSB1 bacterium]
MQDYCQRLLKVNKFIVEVEQAYVVFDSHQALIDINVQIPQNSFVAIVGPNGAGKSTFIKSLLGLVNLTSGTIKIDGRSPQEVSPGDIGYIPQVKTMDRTFPALAIELVITGLDYRWPWKRSHPNIDRAYEALQRVGAEHLANRQISKLSGGELQRVCLARTIAREPKLVMLDEPATGIDAIGETDMYNMLESYQTSSCATILMITHDWHAATHHADYVLLLNRKQISFGPPAEALSEDNLRLAFGHIGHSHRLKFLVK